MNAATITVTFNPNNLSDGGDPASYSGVNMDASAENYRAQWQSAIASAYPGVGAEVSMGVADAVSVEGMDDPEGVEEWCSHLGERIFSAQDFWVNL